MIEEISIGVGFLSKLFDRILAIHVHLIHNDPSAIAISSQKYRQDLKRFRQVLTSLLIDKYTGHWYEHEPDRGQGYRCLLGNGITCDPIIQKAVILSKLNYQCINRALCATTVWIDPLAVAFRIGGYRQGIHDIAVQDSNTMYRIGVDYITTMQDIDLLYYGKSIEPIVSTYLTQRTSLNHISNFNSSLDISDLSASAASPQQRSLNLSNYYQQDQNQEVIESYLNRNTSLGQSSSSPLTTMQEYATFKHAGNSLDMYSVSSNDLATITAALATPSSENCEAAEALKRCSSANNILNFVNASNQQMLTAAVMNNDSNVESSSVTRAYSQQTQSHSDLPSVISANVENDDKQDQSSTQLTKSYTDVTAQRSVVCDRRSSFKQPHQVVDSAKSHQQQLTYSSKTNASRSPSKSTGKQQQKQIKGYCGYVESYPYYYKMGKMQRALLAQRQITNTILQYQQMAANLAAATAAAVVATSSSPSTTPKPYQVNEMRNRKFGGSSNCQLNYNISKSGRIDRKHTIAQSPMKDTMMDSGTSVLINEQLKQRSKASPVDSERMIFMNQCRSHFLSKLSSQNREIIIAAGGNSSYCCSTSPSAAYHEEI